MDIVLHHHLIYGIPPNIRDVFQPRCVVNRQRGAFVGPELHEQLLCGPFIRHLPDVDPEGEADRGHQRQQQYGEHRGVRPVPAPSADGDLRVVFPVERQQGQMGFFCICSRNRGDAFKGLADEARVHVLRLPVHFVQQPVFHIFPGHALQPFRGYRTSVAFHPLTPIHPKRSRNSHSPTEGT